MPKISLKLKEIRFLLKQQELGRSGFMFRSGMILVAI
jgi:hypothetical protein